jgi:IS5 family transposase
LQAHEVECIGKGKAHAPYEFGTKVSIATTLKRSKGGQFALNAMALPGNPYDGHTLKTIIPAMQDTIGADIERILADAGYPSAMRSVVATATTRPTATGSESSPPARNAA